MAHNADSSVTIVGNGQILPVDDPDSITTLFDGYKTDLETKGHTVEPAPASHIHNRRITGNDAEWNFTINSNGKLLPVNDADSIMKLLQTYVLDLVSKGHTVDLKATHIHFSNIEQV